MLTFKEISNTFPLLRWVQQNLAFNSPLGVLKLLSAPFVTTAEKLNSEYDRMDRLCCMLESAQGIEFLNKASHTISTFRDIGNIVENIKSGITLSELELFEVKYFSSNYEYFCSLIQEYDLQLYKIEDLSAVFRLLDPDHTGITSFYLYDTYSAELADLRKKIKKNESSEALYQEIDSVSHKIREQLTASLKPYIRQLAYAMDSVANWDLIIAKVLFAKKFLFCRPVLSPYGKTSYSGLCNPYLQTMLSAKGETYQPVDISLSDSPTLITGANMSGKTIALKSVALAQYLVQFGFYAPATQAQIALVDDVMFLSGDSQSEAKGLSSFGAEILIISDIVETAYQNKQILVLLDEPARTTSPDEGMAIVDAVLEILSEQKIMSLVTTHYNKLKTECRCLRVKGFNKDFACRAISCDSLNCFIDYQLIDARVNEGASEALTVARLLKVSEKLLMKIDSGTSKTQKEPN